MYTFKHFCLVLRDAILLNKNVFFCFFVFFGLLISPVVLVFCNTMGLDNDMDGVDNKC